MSTLREVVYNSVINLHRNTQKEWFHLKEIYEEVAKVKEVKNGAISIKKILETHCAACDAFIGIEEYLLKEKGMELYKSLYYDQIKLIDSINVGDIFNRDQLMNLFKISGQSGMMKTNKLNCLVLTTSERNGVYNDSLVENGTIIYTGEGLEGDQEITKNNKTLYESRETNLPIYLFTKNKDKNYIFEGMVELCDDPYQVHEKDINKNDRLVWKFPLRIMDSEEDEIENPHVMSEIVHEIKKIENNIEVKNISSELVFKEGPLNIRKYKKTGRHVKRNSKPDFIAQEIVKIKQGTINEKDIFKFELNRLTKEGATEQVKEMKDFFDNKRENEGFDVLTFEKDENSVYVKKYIEVKSTKGNEGTPIDITIDEIQFAKEHIDDYYLYRIVNSDSEDRYVKVVKGVELANSFKFVPTTFKIYSD